MIEKLPLLFDTGEDFHLIKRNILFLCFLIIALTGLSELPLHPPSETTSASIIYKLILVTPFASGFSAFILCYLCIPFTYSALAFASNYLAEAAIVLKRLEEERQQHIKKFIKTKQKRERLNKDLEKLKSNYTSDKVPHKLFTEVKNKTEQINDELTILELNLSIITSQFEKLNNKTKKIKIDSLFSLVLPGVTLGLSYPNLFAFIKLIF